MKLNKKNGIPLYIQIKAWLESQIDAGRVREGEKVPSERELSSRFKVSRNTVNMAIKALEMDGKVVSEKGRGVFVQSSQAKQSAHTDRKEQLLFLIDKLIDQAVDLDFDLEQLTSFISAKVFERKSMIRNIQVLFVDCNPEHLFPFIEKVRRKGKVNTDFILLDEFLGRKSSAFVKAYDLVVTTMTHIDELKQAVEDEAKVIGVATTPNLETMVRIVRLKSDNPAGVVAETEKYVESFERALKKAGIKAFKFKTLLKKGKELETFAQKHEVLICSRPREIEVRKMVRALNLHREVIPFFYDMEKGSLDTVLEKIEQIKKRRR